MRFSIPSSMLSAALSDLSKVLSSKNSMAILNCFLFEVNNSELTITASDSDNRMTTRLSVSLADGDGRFCITSQTIADAVKELDDQPITIDVNMETLETKIIYLNGMYKIIAQSADEYPAPVTPPTEPARLTIASSLLAENVTRSLFATAVEELRPVMNGIFFDLQNDSLFVAATDGHKLVRNTIFSIKTEQPSSFILPKKPATLLKNVLAKDDSEVQIDTDGHVAAMYFGDYTLTCRLTEGKYPNYNSVIPQQNNNVIKIDRRVLLSSLRRVLPFSSAQSELVRLRIESGKVEVSAEDLDFSTSAKEEAICEYDGMPMSIGFKGTVLCDILNNLDSEEVIIKLADPTRAGIVLPAQQPDQQETLMLLMPMLLND